MSECESSLLAWSGTKDLVWRERMGFAALNPSLRYAPASSSDNAPSIAGMSAWFIGAM